MALKILGGGAAGLLTGFAIVALGSLTGRWWFRRFHPKKQGRWFDNPPNLERLSLAEMRQYGDEDPMQHGGG